MNNEFIRLFETLSNLYEGTERKSPHKQKLVKDLEYTTIEEVLDGKEIVTQYTRLSGEELLQAYKAGGFINDNDTIVFPAGTVFTWVKSIEPDLYDLYHVQGKNKCLIAVAPEYAVELFGEVAYKE